MSGLRYRPEVTEMVKSFAVLTAAGVHIDTAVNMDQTKVAVEAVGPHYLSSAGTVSLGMQTGIGYSGDGTLGWGRSRHKTRDGIV